jgi:hypothetical protein
MGASIPASYSRKFHRNGHLACIDSLYVIDYVFSGERTIPTWIGTLSKLGKVYFYGTQNVERTRSLIHCFLLMCFLFPSELLGLGTNLGGTIPTELGLLTSLSKCMCRDQCHDSWVREWLTDRRLVLNHIYL